MARNAKDNAVSYFHFDRMNLTQPEPGPWDGYVDKFMKGQCKIKLHIICILYKLYYIHVVHIDVFISEKVVL